MAGLLDELQKGDKLVIYELSRLGRSLLDVIEFLHEAKQRGIGIYEVKTDTQLNGEDSIQGKVNAIILNLFRRIANLGNF